MLAARLYLELRLRDLASSLAVVLSLASRGADAAGPSRGCYIIVLLVPDFHRVAPCPRRSARLFNGMPRRRGASRATKYTLSWCHVHPPPAPPFLRHFPFFLRGGARPGARLLASNCCEVLWGGQVD